MYPSPGGATESELHFDSWSRMLELNPVLTGIEPDIEGLIANRLSDPPIHVIAPIDRCYALTGTIKAHWEASQEGAGVDTVPVARFFGELRSRSSRIVTSWAMERADRPASLPPEPSPGRPRLELEFLVLGRPARSGAPARRRC